jgi:hypothetical protein
MHEVKTQLESLSCAVNQLAKSLAFALDQQEELRQLAEAPEEERLPVFGVASEGCQVKLWCGAYVGNEIVSWATRRRARRVFLLACYPHLTTTAHRRLAPYS